MDKHLYLQILQEDLKATIEEYGLNEEEITFQHDNDSKHKSGIVGDWLNNQKFRTMPWPAYSPDLNPIENVWALLKKRLYSNYDRPPKGQDELWKRIVETWYAITPEVLQPFYHSMGERCVEVIEKKGY